MQSDEGILQRGSIELECIHVNNDNFLGMGNNTSQIGFIVLLYIVIKTTLSYYAGGII